MSFLRELPDQNLCCNLQEKSDVRDLREDEFGLELITMQQRELCWVPRNTL